MVRARVRVRRLSAADVCLRQTLFAAESAADIVCGRRLSVAVVCLRQNLRQSLRQTFVCLRVCQILADSAKSAADKSAADKSVADKLGQIWQSLRQTLSARDSAKSAAEPAADN